MILVDTSVLIDYLKGTENTKSELFQEILDRDLPFGITKLIFLEVLHGSKTEQELDLLKDYLISIPLYDLVNYEDSYPRAALINITCRKTGITIRSTIDLLIAVTAIENDVGLLHNDRDFDNIASVIPELKIVRRLDFN